MRFDCFGSRCGVWAATPEAEDDARRCLENWHVRFSRFLARPPSSRRLNADPREVVPVSTTMTRLVATVREAAEATGGLVDGTLLGEIEAAGYVGDLAAAAAAAARAAARPRAPPRPRRIRTRAGASSRSTAGRSAARTACASTAAAWPRACSPTCSPSGCDGDVRRRLRRRPALLRAGRGGWRSPTRSAARRVHVFELEARGRHQRHRPAQLARPDGRPAHHLLDPATGRPAFTGVVQATALAPTAVEAEWRAKAAVLSGPDRAGDWLAHGGVVVLDDGTHFVTQPNAIKEHHDEQARL